MTLEHKSSVKLGGGGGGIFIAIAKIIDFTFTPKIIRY